MGGGQSRQALLERYGQLLNHREREAVNKCFVAIAGRLEAESFSREQFLAYEQKTSQEVVNGYFRAFSCVPSAVNRQKLPHSHVSYAGFVQQVNCALKGSVENRAHLVLALCSGQTLTVKRLQMFLVSFLHTILMADKSTMLIPSLTTWNTCDDPSLNRFVQYMVHSCSDEQESDAQLSQSDLESWLGSTPLAVQVLQLTTALCFLHPHLPGSDIQDYTGNELTPELMLLPQVVHHPMVGESFQSQLLDQASAIFVNSALPFEVRGRLYPLFSSRHHGESFSTLCKQIIDHGPTLLLVKDKGGFVFGAYAADSWRYHPQFTGSSGCFLFTLSPTMGVFSPSGYNNNFMYMQQNAQTLPNGIGMGGQIDYFGFWLSADYGTGHSRAKPKCSTYGSPCLSSEEEFEVDIMEAWGVGTPALPEGQKDMPHSILDHDKSAQAILDLAGKTRHSEGLREPEDKK